MIVPTAANGLKLAVLVVAVASQVYLVGSRETLTQLLAGLGLVGLAASLAAQDTLKNFFGTLLLIGEHPFRIGEHVAIQGMEGVVESVGFRSTRVRTFEDSLLTIPNSVMAAALIDNRAMRSCRRFRLLVSMAYSTPADRMIALRDGLRSYGSVRLSPDGRRVALGLVDAGKPPDIWIFDVNRGSLSRFTFGPASNFNPVWTPDGSRIIYSSERPVFDLYAKPADSGGDEQLIATTSRDKYAGSVSPDGRVLLGTSSVEDEGENLLAFPLTGGGQPEPFLVTAMSERAPIFSPDGRWVAYSSDESDPGVTQEIYLRSYPGGETRHQVSTDGGNQAVWARSGRELFYRAGRRVMRVPVAPDGRPGTPSALFEFDETSCETEDRAACYDVSLDGQQFYMLQPAEPARAQATIELVLNAFAELNRLAR
jgi:dipeptidyl aminopeptidase/acylaminoacyl peptidase